MDIIIVEGEISLEKLKELAKKFYGDMIKGVVDIEKEIVAFGGEYHIDANTLITENGSEQKNVWGFNVHFNRPRDFWIEYNSLINIRPLAKNNHTDVQDNSIKEKMKQIINSKII